VDLRFLPDILTLSVFIVAFRPLVRRVGKHVNWWFLGWTLILLRYVALMLMQPSGLGREILQSLSVAFIGLSGIVFMVVIANVPKRRMTEVQIVAFAVAILYLAVLEGFNVADPHARLVGALLLMLPAAYLFLVPQSLVPQSLVPQSLVPQKKDRCITMLSVAFALLGAVLIPFVHSDPFFGASGAVSLLFLSCAFLSVVQAPVFTRGVAAAVLGFVGWGLTVPLLAVLGRYFPGVVPDRALLEVPQYLVIAGTILTLLEEHVQRTERMAMHDPLTELPNRRLLEERLIRTMEDARRERTTVACLVIDVDNFKTINDTLGHDAGDQLLRALAVRLGWHMSPRDILARTGGDEFTAMLAGVTDENHLRFIASAMMSAASVPIAVDGGSVDVRISVGIALSPDDADDVESLRRAADEAMYTAKRGGGSRLAFAGDK